ncbi:MAG: hypothetical protein ACYC5M_09560 [Anaerolineae bacterium]
MFRFLTSLAGLWVGVVAVAFPTATALLFALTGRVPVPDKGAVRLVMAAEAPDYLRNLIESSMEKHDA